MLKVIADIFSGRPNPQWVIADDEARQILDRVSKNVDSIDFSDTRFLGLGYRGLVLEVVSGGIHHDTRLPSSFRISNSTSAGAEISERIIESMPTKALYMDLGGIDLVKMQRILREQNALSIPKLPTQATITQAQMKQMAKFLQAWISFLRKGGCNHEEIAFDPSFWNDPAHVSLNNCYNFATNRRTDTFAQPGKASGHMYTSIDCATVTAAAVSDGAIVPLPCPPDDQIPRYWIALVIKPSWPEDYHWYRRCTEGFWAHKPGHTQSRYTDNSGQMILDPENCDRGPYTIFCGYLYTQKKMSVI
jgi:hypothetical protein